MYWNTGKLMSKLVGVKGIYIFKNKLNGKVYIGQSVDLNMRYYTHTTRDNHCIFSSAIKKYGKDGFYFGILEKVRYKEDLDRRETYWISFYQSFKRENGYNIHSLPKGFRGKKSEEHKKKISKAHKGKIRSSIEMDNVFNGRLLKDSKNKHVPVEMIDPVTNRVIGIYPSVNIASKDTSVPRRSIDAVVHNTPFYNKDKTKLHYMTLAGGFKWRKLDIKPTDNLWEIRKNCFSYNHVPMITTTSSRHTLGFKA